MTSGRTTSLATRCEPLIFVGHHHGVGFQR
jgi:hypothetical protein